MHFILGRSATCIPETELINEPLNKFTQHQRRQQLIQHFWVRWSKEVIPTYQRRNKWFRDTDVDIKIGLLVLLSNSNTKPLQWPLARVVETFPSPSDGKIHLLTLTMGRTEAKIAVTDTLKLPVTILSKLGFFPKTKSERVLIPIIYLTILPAYFLAAALQFINMDRDLSQYADNLEVVIAGVQ
ncbi:hypothetical protein ILUMI_17858, partial [Ignelater luminosus]